MRPRKSCKIVGTQQLAYILRGFVMAQTTAGTILMSKIALHQDQQANRPAVLPHLTDNLVLRLPFGVVMENASLLRGCATATMIVKTP